MRVARIHEPTPMRVAVALEADWAHVMAQVPAVVTVTVPVSMA